MNPLLEHAALMTRRHFFGRASLGPGVLALASLLGDKLFAATDQPSPHFKPRAKRGLLDDTLVIWGGEFGRTVYCQGTLTAENYGRDHHPRCFTVFLAGGGIKAGLTHGESDDFCYNITRDPVHVHDLHATMLHCLGIEHTRLTVLFQARHHRLTDVHGNVVKEILAAAASGGRQPPVGSATGG